ncbi:cell division protein FtsK [Mycobacteroides abscessus]|nr:cell division protein FtsK [Mycobacteroides abscessus]
MRRARAGRVVYLSPRRTSISALDAWDTVATSPEEVVTLLETLTQAIEGGSLRPGTLTVLVESVTEFTGTPAEQPLVAFVRAATRAEQLVVGEAESSTWGQAWAIAQPFKAGRTGLLLTPGDLDGDTLLGTGLGRIRRADFPPGRGFLVVSGRARKLHVALPR